MQLAPVDKSGKEAPLPQVPAPMNGAAPTKSQLLGYLHFKHACRRTYMLRKQVRQTGAANRTRTRSHRRPHARAITRTRTHPHDRARTRIPHALQTLARTRTRTHPRAPERAHALERAHARAPASPHALTSSRLVTRRRCFPRGAGGRSPRSPSRKADEHPCGRNRRRGAACSGEEKARAFRGGARADGNSGAQDAGTRRGQDRVCCGRRVEFARARPADRMRCTTRPRRAEPEILEAAVGVGARLRASCSARGAARAGQRTPAVRDGEKDRNNELSCGRYDGEAHPQPQHPRAPRQQHARNHHAHTVPGRGVWRRTRPGAHRPRSVRGVQRTGASARPPPRGTRVNPTRTRSQSGNHRRRPND